MVVGVVVVVVVVMVVLVVVAVVGMVVVDVVGVFVGSWAQRDPQHLKHLIPSSHSSPAGMAG